MWLRARWDTLQGLLTLLGVLLVAGPLAALPFREEPVADGKPRLPRVILITIDTLRRDALSVYGGATSTPNIDELAGDSVVFHRASSSAPWTVPSMTTIMTGRTPFVHGVTGVSHSGFGGVPPLAERMFLAGYQTMSVGYNPFLGSRHAPGTGAQRGFSVDSFAPVTPYPHTEAFDLAARLFPRFVRWDLSTEDITEIAGDWITTHGGARTFSWVHYFDPHMPYEPPAEYLPDAEPVASIGTSFHRWHAGTSPHRMQPEEIAWARELYLGRGASRRRLRGAAAPAAEGRTAVRRVADRPDQ